jgi:hypothetical protein
MGKFQRLKQFFTPASFERRGRTREYRELAKELQTIDSMRRWCDGREPVIEARLHELALGDLLDGLPVSNYGRHTPSPPPSRDKIDGEYVKVPRSMRDAFGAGAGDIYSPDDMRYYWKVAIAYAVCVGLIAYSLRDLVTWGPVVFEQLEGICRAMLNG